MHITQNILSKCGSVLERKYGIYVQPNEWQLFQESLLDNSGEIDKVRFERRQTKSIEILRQILDVNGKGNIVKFLGNLAIIEPKIQDLQPWVRDHVVHAINTFLLGVYILEESNFPHLKRNRYDYPFMWKLCGPTHDLGYPVEIARNIATPFVNEVNKIFDDLKSTSPRIAPESYLQNLEKLCNGRDANEYIQNRLTEWALGIDISDYYGWLKSKNRTDHGVISALVQLKVIDAMYNDANPLMLYENLERGDLNFNQANFDFDIVSASSALFVHNIDLNYFGFSNKISFDISPLAFLLFLCDTFQEWDRYAENRTIYSGARFDIDCRSNMISLVVPDEIEPRVYAAIYQRLTGMLVKVNGRVATT